MKKIFIGLGLLILSAIGIAETNIDFDTTNWEVRPENYGMTSREYVETESYSFMKEFIDRSGLNKPTHFKSLSKAGDNWVVSPNRDTLYSIMTVKTTKGFTLKLPEMKGRFLGVQFVNADHTVPFYETEGGKYTYTRDDFQSDYVAIGVRIGTDGTQEDIDFIVNKLQPQIEIIGADMDDSDFPVLDKETMIKLREKLLPHYKKLPNTIGVAKFANEKVEDGWKYIITAAGAWGLSPDSTAMYTPYAPKIYDMKNIYSATYKTPDVKEFFSITVYNSDNYLMTDKYSIVSSATNIVYDDKNKKTFTVNYVPHEMIKKAEEMGLKNIISVEEGWNTLMRFYVPNVESVKNYNLPKLKLVKIK